MSAAIEELERVAATSRDARIFSCLSHAQSALLYAQRGCLRQTLESLTVAELVAERHQGATNDPRARSALVHVRSECRVALQVMLPTREQS